MLLIMRSYMHNCHFIWLNNLCFNILDAKVTKYRNRLMLFCNFIIFRCHFILRKGVLFGYFL